MIHRPSRSRSWSGSRLLLRSRSGLLSRHRLNLSLSGDCPRLLTRFLGHRLLTSGLSLGSLTSLFSLARFLSLTGFLGFPCFLSLARFLNATLSSLTSLLTSIAFSARTVR